MGWSAIKPNQRTNHQNSPKFNKRIKLDEPDMQDTAGEAEMNS